MLCPPSNRRFVPHATGPCKRQGQPCPLSSEREADDEADRFPRRAPAERAGLRSRARPHRPSSPSSLPVDRLTRCSLVHAWQITGAWVPSSRSGVDSIQCWTLKPVWGHLKMIGRSIVKSYGEAKSANLIYLKAQLNNGVRAARRRNSCPPIRANCLSLLNVCYALVPTRFCIAAK